MLEDEAAGQELEQGTLDFRGINRRDGRAENFRPSSAVRRTSSALPEFSTSTVHVPPDGRLECEQFGGVSLVDAAGQQCVEEGAELAHRLA